MYLIPTKHSARIVNTSKVYGQGNIVKKPKAIVHYNTNMGGIDRMDQQLHGIQVLRKTYKWYQEMFFASYCCYCLVVTNYTNLEIER